MLQIVNTVCDKIKAEDAVVIVDVFRATSVMLYLFFKGIERIYPVDNIEEISKHYLYVGEVNGYKPKNFNYNNSPFEIINSNIVKKDVYHLSSLGTKAFLLFKEKTHNIYVGSLLNAKPLALHLKNKYRNIYIYPTNTRNIHKYNEDYICSEYIQSLINNKKYDIFNKIDILSKYKNSRFMKKNLQDRFPKEDFYLCTKVNSIRKILIYNGKHIEEVKDERNRKKILD